MTAKAYVLLNVASEKHKQVVRTLRGKPGVLMIDVVEGPPDVVAVLGARSRQRLAKLTIQALASVEAMTEGLQLLPTRDKLNARGVSKTTRARRSEVKESHLPGKMEQEVPR